LVGEKRKKEVEKGGPQMQRVQPPNSRVFGEYFRMAIFEIHIALNCMQLFRKSK